MINKVSEKTVVLLHLLRQLKDDEILSYAAMSAALGLPRSEFKHNLYSARNTLRNQGEACFLVIPNVGVRKLPDRDLATTSDVFRKRSRNAARRGIRHVVCVKDFDSMQNNEKLEHNSRVAQFGAIACVTRPSKLKQLRRAMSLALFKAPPREALKLFSK